MSTFTEEKMFRYLVLLIIDEMAKSQSEEIRKKGENLKKDLCLDSPMGISRDVFFLRVILPLRVVEDWRTNQIATLIAFDLHQTIGMLPEDRGAKIGLDLDEFIFGRGICLEALELYEKLFQSHGEEEETEPEIISSNAENSAFDDLVLTMLSDGVLITSDEEMDAIIDAYEQKTRKITAYLQTPESYMHQLTEPECVCWRDLAGELLERLEIEQVVSSNPEELDEIIFKLRSI